tara:strand:- start:381 stop:953 length:573 start_codon:yes stop_codon:yes gene_type:complete
MEKKEDSKKGNKEEQKRMEGAIRDNEIHIDKLNKDIKADRKKLSKLKKDEPKDVNEAEVTETPKLTKEGLKSMIREKITSILNEDSIEEQEIEDDEVDDVNIDIDKEEDIKVKDKETVDIDDESSKSEMEIDGEIAGESSEKAAVLSLLTKAQEMVPSLGADIEKNEKMVNQINNTITMFARDYLAQSPK